MLSIFNGLRDLGFVNVLLRMIVAFVIGGVIGLERSYNNKSAGFRTHILVCLGACIASMTGQYLYLELGLPADMSRIPTQVISGLSFIGAGTIVVTKKNTVKGLTTAAGLWTAGIIGIAIGAAFYEGALVAAALVLLCETAMNNVRSKIMHYPEFVVAVSYAQRNNLDDVLRYSKDRGLSITNRQVTGVNMDGESIYSSLLTLRPGSEIDKVEFLKKINQMEGIVSAEEA